ncbi:hypothetical protein AMTRI_Chr08g168590 [Amborella trichopoda]
MSGLFKPAKISSFFKPFATNDSSPLTNELEETANSRERKDILATYRRRTPINKPSCEERDDDFTSGKEDEAVRLNSKDKIQLFSSNSESNIRRNYSSDSIKLKYSSDSIKSWQESNPMSGTVNKKRNHSQCYLELGQSDLMLHTCSLCGLQYSCGDEEDERVHKAFHKKYIQGVQFKGWHNERVICTYPDNGEHIVLILNGDPPTHRQRVQEVAKIMVKELNLDDEWLVHKFCKVYLRISSQRIVGCLVAEPIRYAYKVISNCSCPSIIHSSSSSAKENFKTKNSNSKKIADEFFGAAILCEMEPMPAVCGIRAIWNFLMGYVLEPSQLAFSQPTSLGKAFATKYCSTNSFLVYKSGIER